MWTVVCLEKRKGKKEKHTTAGICWWSPTPESLLFLFVSSSFEFVFLITPNSLTQHIMWCHMIKASSLVV